ncbi:hypothetical protein J2Z32_002512 [Paenibacillus turicensis]|uniref:DUF4365 domain-containing protein n=1 Tax=Paenibacillus turicensis TaxID=160487 RepID=A0ABS4FTT7_9BACL|nr:DUF4365 domain-containing protein [Paenibacillus turicensis]MBP1905864.1 hypothetical protein [Paenibacillus turicensis]
MAKLSNATIERIAVQAIRNAVNTEPYMLRAEIPEGDKGISFDGKIEVFTDDSEKTESYYGSVPVQVKGTTVNTFSGQERQFRVSISHLKNYYKNSGVIFFVVEIDQNRQEKIYYRQLLPLDLSYMIRSCNSKKSKSTQIELRSIDNTNIDRICRLFLKEQKHQPLSLIEERPFLNNSFNTYNMRSLTIQPTLSNLSEIFKHDFFVYGVINKLQVPLNKARITTLSRDSTIIIEIDHNPYTFNTYVNIEQNTITITIEHVLNLTFFENKVNITLISFHSLLSQIKIIPLLIGFIEKKSIKILDNEISAIRFAEDDLLSFRKDMETQLEFIEELEQAFLFFGINKEIIFNESKEGLSLINGFELLIGASKNVDFPKLKMKLPEGNGFINAVIGDQTIVFLYNNSKFTNPFNEDITKSVSILSYQEKDECNHSIYTLLNIDSLANGVNVNFNKIQTSFDNFNPYFNELAFNTTIHFCLKCIAAYDKSHKKELLHLADYIFSKYRMSAKNKNIDKDSVIIYVNRLQISKRLHGSLNDEEIDILINIKDCFNANEFMEIHFCTNVLLESKIEANRAYTRFDIDLKTRYETMPILTLYRNLIN